MLKKLFVTIVCLSLMNCGRVRILGEGNEGKSDDEIKAMKGKEEDRIKE